MESDGVIGEPVPLRAASAQETAAAEQLERWYARALELALGGEAILLGEHTATLQSFIDEHPGYFEGAAGERASSIMLERGLARQQAAQESAGLASQSEEHKESEEPDWRLTGRRRRRERRQLELQPR